MNSIERVVHIEGRAALHTTTRDATPVMTFVRKVTEVPELPSSQAVRIQQATVFTSQQFTIPASTVLSNNNPTMPATVAGSAAPVQEPHGLSSTSIAGFAMIPVAVILIAANIFLFFWMRNRRRRSPVIRHLDLSPPPVSQKDFGSPTGSIDSEKSGKVRSMMFGTTVGFTGRGAVEAANESPIDRSSPFRLKRGNTKKRTSLDDEITSAWPLPPQPLRPVKPHGGQTYMERRSISAEYFAQERDIRDARGAHAYWEEVRLDLGPGPGPTYVART